MSKAKHTPGPWFYNGDEGSETAKYGHNVNTARGVIAEIEERGGKTEHNARLIAAAPELLAALEKLIASYDPAQRPAEYGWHDAIAAVKRAKGE